MSKLEEEIGARPSRFRHSRCNANKWAVRMCYEKIEAELRDRYYPKLACRDADKHNLDHHKIAACFCKALIKNKLFAFDINEETTQKVLLSNYELAYTVSLRILYLYLIYYYDKEGNTEAVSKLTKNGHLFVPRTTRNHDDYNLGRIKALAFNDFYGIEFDLLGYADMLYWIEHYTRQVLEEKVDINAYE